MAGTYEVTGQRPTTSITRAGTIGPFMVVAFVTKPSNVPGELTISLAEYTPEQVDALLTAQAAVMEQVAHL